MRRVLVAGLVLGACFKVPAFDSGGLRCERGQCPPGMECRADGFCYRPGELVIDAPIVIDAVPCTDGDHRCAGGNLELCRGTRWVPATPTCAAQGAQCFDPGDPGGTDAYCGTCLKGAQRCTATTPAVRQTCPDGIWTDAETCDATFGCRDPDGPDAPAAYCAACTDGDKRCTPGLETCNAGQWSAPEDCTATVGWSCFDPEPAGGNDAYCGLCLKGSVICQGDNRAQCNASGTGYSVVETCSWGCNPTGPACCAPPDC